MVLKITGVSFLGTVLIGVLALLLFRPVEVMVRRMMRVMRRGRAGRFGGRESRGLLAQGGKGGVPW